MSDSLVLEPLRYIRAAVDGLAAVRREIAHLAEADAHLSARMDRMSDRVERIERRLDIVS